ncbi:MAG: sulfate/molybdate ABC transporter ATP-binding protein [Candidatus Margulisiibacteriota bacterium]
MSIVIQNVEKQYGDFPALYSINLAIKSGELVALLGPSGSGKTTLLRLIAGLETLDSGQILFNGQNIQDKAVRERQVGFVFQHYALFRHMTVAENIGFGLSVRPRSTRPSKAEIAKRVDELLKLVQLEKLGDRYPSQLSGGQRQRVALARAIAIEPQVLLLDEPFGALDANVRKELRSWLRQLHNELHITSVFVTHDVEEALEVADRIVVMNHGKIEQIGTPEAVYQKPANPFVYQFIGSVNLFYGRIENGSPVLSFDASEKPFYVRPHELQLNRSATQDNALSATIVQLNTVGPLVRVELVGQNNTPITVDLSQEIYRVEQFQKGDTVFVSPKHDQVLFGDYSI